MRSRPVAVLTAVLLLGTTAACSDDEPLAQPLSPSRSAVPSAQESPSPSPAPSPSPTPLSPFEADPAVQAVREYLVVSAQALNAKNLSLPALRALSTASRQAEHDELFAEDLGTYFPGPPPTAVVGVRVVSATKRHVAVCELDDGFALDKPGGRPTEPRLVVAGRYEMALEDGRWKVDTAVLDDGRSCDGVPLPGEPA